MSDTGPEGSEHDRMAAIQGAGHGDNHDYVRGSPHLRHAALNGRVVGAITKAIETIESRQGTCSVLEVGAGHGTFTSSVLTAGATVTVTEMSRPSAEYLQSTYADNPSVTVVYDGDGEELFRRHDQFDLVLFISVLHHIPDYVDFVRRTTDELVRPGGAIVTYQDPLWYPRQSRLARLTSVMSYFAWRLAQGEIRRGLSTRWRRLRGQLDESNVADMVEYHVVREGVDDKALRTLLAEDFEAVESDEYWSTQSAVLQRLGAGIFAPNMFGIVAVNRRSDLTRSPRHAL